MRIVSFEVGVPSATGLIKSSGPIFSYERSNHERRD